MNKTGLVLGFAEYAPQGQRLAEALGCPYAQIQVHRFPDGERLVTLPPELPEEIVFCRSLNDPDHKLIELLLGAETARAAGARRLTLVAPYLCYMRQDIAFHPGEAVSQRIIGRLLAGLFDRVLSVDAHLHRIDRLGQALPGIQAINLSAGPLFAECLGQRSDQPLLVGPDGESAQWVETIARAAGLESVVASKRRLGDQKVEVRLPDGAYRERAIVLVDDIISTGNTLMRVTEQLSAAGAGSVEALVTHALFDAETGGRLQAAGIRKVWSTDSVPHPSNHLWLAPLLARALTDSDPEQTPE